MGHYTEFCFKVKLNKDLPKEFTNFIEGLNFADLEEWQENIKKIRHNKTHPLFSTSRLVGLFSGVNISQDTHRPYLKTFEKFHVLRIHSQFKNNGEIEHFLNFIEPFVITRKLRYYVGFYEYEHDIPRTNIYYENGKFVMQEV